MVSSESLTICVLVYGDYCRLAERVLSSIWNNVPRSAYQLIVGANAVGEPTRQFLSQSKVEHRIDELVVSDLNLSKCPMMRRLFAQVSTEYIWWFDDDSFITDAGAWLRWLREAEASSAETVMWGELGECDHPMAFTEVKDVLKFVRSASWYRGLPPPSWRPGGKGEFLFRGQNGGDGRWIFVLGGCWLIRSAAVRAIDWPDYRLRRHGDDVFLGEAIRQHGWKIAGIHPTGVAINTERRRGERVPDPR